MPQRLNHSGLSEEVKDSIIDLLAQALIADIRQCPSLDKSVEGFDRGAQFNMKNERLGITDSPPLHADLKQWKERSCER